MHFLLYPTFAASAWAAITSAGPCASDQATSWSLLTPDLRAPSWPFECLHVYELPCDITLGDLGADQGVSTDDLLAWNCFNRDQIGELDQGTEVCVYAVLEEHTQSPEYRLPEITKVFESTTTVT
jgi:hypothetical protein